MTDYNQQAIQAVVEKVEGGINAALADDLVIHEQRKPYISALRAGLMLSEEE